MLQQQSALTPKPHVPEVMQEKFLPDRHMITKFGEGGFHFGGMSHLGSLLILPSGMRALVAKTLNEISIEMISGVADEKSEIDFLLIGTGKTFAHAPTKISTWLKAESINFDVMDTSAALRTYNVVLDEGRRVAAILIAVD
jgi:uncharacterized protein